MVLQQSLLRLTGCARDDNKLCKRANMATGHITLSPLDLNHACSTIEAKSSKLKDRLSKKLDKKFNDLKRKKR